MLVSIHLVYTIRNESRLGLGTCLDKSVTVWIPIETLAGGGVDMGPATILARYGYNARDNPCKVRVRCQRQHLQRKATGTATTLARYEYSSRDNPYKVWVRFQRQPLQHEGTGPAPTLARYRQRWAQNRYFVNSYL